MGPDYWLGFLGHKSSTAHHNPLCILFLSLLAITLGEFSQIVPVCQQHSQFPTRYLICLRPPLACNLLGIQQDPFCPLFLLVSQSLQFYQRFHVSLNYNFCHFEYCTMLSLSGASNPSRRTHIIIFVVVTLLIILIAMIFVCSFPFVFVIPSCTTCGTCFRFTDILKVRVASTLNKILILFRYVCPGTSS